MGGAGFLGDGPNRLLKLMAKLFCGKFVLCHSKAGDSSFTKYKNDCKTSSPVPQLDPLTVGE